MIIWSIKWQLRLLYFAHMVGTSTAIYPAATMNNMTVLGETSQHPQLNVLWK